MPTVGAGKWCFYSLILSSEMQETADPGHVAGPRRLCDRLVTPTKARHPPRLPMAFRGYIKIPAGSWDSLPETCE